MSWRRVLLLSLGFVLALASVTWVALQRSGAATSILRRALAEALRAPFAVARTELDLGNGRLIVHGLRIDDPTRAGTALLAAERVDLDLAADPFGELVSLYRVAVDGLVVDLGAPPPAVAELLRPRAGDGGGAAAVPAVEVTGAVLRATAVAGRPPFELADVTLTALPTVGAPRVLGVRGEGSIPHLGTRVSLAGHVDPARGAFDVTVAFAEIRIDDALLAWLDERLGIERADIAAAGALRDFEVTLATAADGAGMRVEARGTIAGTRLTGARLPRHLRDATITFVASSDRGGDLVVRVAQTNEQGEIDVTADITHLLDEPSFALRARGRRLVLDDDMLHALRLVPIGSRVVDALAPTAGSADIDLYLRNPHLPTGLAEFDMDLRDVAMSYRGFGPPEHRIGFPLPLVDARGRVRLRDDVVLLEQLAARIAEAAGGGDVTLSGRVDTAAASGEDVTIDLGITDVTFTESLHESVNALLGEDGDLYQRLSPSGRADVDVKIRPASILPTGWAVVVEPKAATVTWSGFPYRLEDLNGTITCSGAVVDFDIAGRHGAGTVGISGRIPVDSTAPDRPGIEVAMRLDGLAIDEELRRAVIVRAPAIGDYWSACAPTGTCGGVVRAWQASPDDPFGLDLRIDIDGVDLELPARPWRAHDLGGRLVITGSGDRVRIDFDALRGELGHGSGPSAQLAMLGAVWGGDATESNLSLVVRGLQLDGQLGRTLEELGALSPGVWNYLHPTGAVDLVGRHRLRADGGDEFSLVVHLLEVGSDAPILPRPARKMTGELRVADGKLTFDEVRAELGGHLVRCRLGSIAPGDEDEARARIAFEVAAADFPLDRGFANLFSGPLHDAIADRELSGAADIDKLELVFLVPTHDDTLPFETTLKQGQLRLQDVGMRLGAGRDGIRVDGIHGLVTLEESRVGATGGALLGTWRDGALRLFGQQFEAVGARFAADAEHMALEQLEARFHGGIVTGGAGGRPAVSYLLPGPEVPDGRLAADLAFEGVDVRGFLLATGQESPPYRGLARGRFALTRLDGQDIVDAQAEGALAISRGDLGVVPLFTAIYSFLPAPERPRFDGLDLDFRLADRRVAFDRLVLRSNLVGAKGSGALDPDGYLDVRLTLENLLGHSADPLFMPLIDFFTKNIVRFHLFGHLRDLKAEKRWLTERSPPRPPVPPVPPVAPRRHRPSY